MPLEQIQKAVQFYKSGDINQAIAILSRVVKKEPNNSEAWYGLAVCQPEKEKKIYALEKVLAIKPDHTQAKQLLEHLAPTGGFEDLPLPTQPGGRTGKKDCTYCGEPLQPSAKFCRYCGRNLKTGELPVERVETVVVKKPKNKAARFVKKFLFNLVLVLIAIVVMYLIMPDVFGQVYQFMGMMFGPTLIALMIITAALPGRR